MTPQELPQLVAHYRAGLEAEMTLLHRLESLALRQRETSELGDFEALADVSDQRDVVMAGLVRIEHELKPVRSLLLEYRRALHEIVEFQDVAALHHTAALLIERIVTDEPSRLAREIDQLAIDKGGRA